MQNALLYMRRAFRDFRKCFEQLQKFIRIHMCALESKQSFKKFQFTYTSY